MVATKPNFPRPDDHKPHAWGLKFEEPHEVYERFSNAYEEQAEALWQEFESRGWEPSLEWAGSEDGECILGSVDGNCVIILSLEWPEEAKKIINARSQGRLEIYIDKKLKE